MANLKPLSFIKESLLKEERISPEPKPACIVAYRGTDYVIVRPMDNGLGWVMYSGHPEKQYHHAPGGVEVPFDDELYTRPIYLPTRQSIALVKDILKRIADVKKVKKGSAIPASSGPTEIMQYVRDGKINYEEAIQFMSSFDPRWLVTVAKYFKQPNYKVEDTLVNGKQSGLLADYAIRAVGKPISKRAEEIIKLDPTAWNMYKVNLKLV